MDISDPLVGNIMMQIKPPANNKLIIPEKTHEINN